MYTARATRTDRPETIRAGQRISRPVELHASIAVAANHSGRVLFYNEPSSAGLIVHEDARARRTVVFVSVYVSFRFDVIRTARRNFDYENNPKRLGDHRARTIRR